MQLPTFRHCDITQTRRQQPHPSMVSLPLQYSDTDDTNIATPMIRKESAQCQPRNQHCKITVMRPELMQAGTRRATTGHVSRDTCVWTPHTARNVQLNATGKVPHGCCCLPAPGCSSDATLERAQLWWCIRLCSCSNDGRDATALHTRTHAPTHSTHAQTIQHACGNTQHKPPTGKHGAHKLAHTHISHRRLPHKLPTWQQQLHPCIAAGQHDKHHSGAIAPCKIRPTPPQTVRTQDTADTTAYLTSPLLSL
jgi:hypothetical protein